jgi:hypothetical protein
VLDLFFLAQVESFDALSLSDEATDLCLLPWSAIHDDDIAFPSVRDALRLAQRHEKAE